MEGFISEMAGGRMSKGGGEIVKSVKNVKLRAQGGLEVVVGAVVVDFTAIHTPVRLHESAGQVRRIEASIYTGGVARIDQFFSGRRNGNWKFPREVEKKNFEKVGRRNREAQ
jgi:hypothetical protein